MIEIDIPMPSCCDECFALDFSGDYPCCIISEECQGYNFNVYENRMPSCPLKDNEPRVLTHEEFKAYRLGVSPKERLPLWTEWKKDKRKNRYTRTGVDTDAYGTEWRCWSARPTEERREATPWME